MTLLPDWSGGSVRDEMRAYADAVAAGGILVGAEMLVGNSNLVGSPTATPVAGLNSIEVPAHVRPTLLLAYAPVIASTAANDLALVSIARTDWDGDHAGAQLDRVLNWGGFRCAAINDSGRPAPVFGLVPALAAPLTFGVRIARSSGAGNVYLSSGFGSLILFAAIRV